MSSYSRTLVFICIALMIMLCTCSIAFSQMTEITWRAASNHKALIKLPASYSALTTKKYPVMIAFHGNGEAGTNTSLLYNAGIPRIIQNGTLGGKVSDSCIIVCPQAQTSTEFNANRPLIADLLNYLFTNYRVDTLTKDYFNRWQYVALTGFSQGASVVFDLVANDDWAYSTRIRKASLFSTPAIFPASIYIAKFDDRTIFMGHGDPDTQGCCATWVGEQLYNDMKAAGAYGPAFRKFNAGGNGHNNTFWDSMHSDEGSDTTNNLWRWAIAGSVATTAMQKIIIDPFYVMYHWRPDYSAKESAHHLFTGQSYLDPQNGVTGNTTTDSSFLRAVFPYSGPWAKLRDPITGTLDVTLDLRVPYTVKKIWYYEKNFTGNTGDSIYIVGSPGYFWNDHGDPDTLAKIEIGPNPSYWGWKSVDVPNVDARMIRIAVKNNHLPTGTYPEIKQILFYGTPLGAIPALTNYNYTGPKRANKSLYEIMGADIVGNVGQAKTMTRPFKYIREFMLRRYLLPDTFNYSLTNPSQVVWNPELDGFYNSGQYWNMKNFTDSLKIMGKIFWQCINQNFLFNQRMGMSSTGMPYVDTITQTGWDTSHYRVNKRMYQVLAEVYGSVPKDTATMQYVKPVWPANQRHSGLNTVDYFTDENEPELYFGESPPGVTYWNPHTYAIAHISSWLGLRSVDPTRKLFFAATKGNDLDSNWVRETYYWMRQYMHDSTFTPDVGIEYHTYPVDRTDYFGSVGLGPVDYEWERKMRKEVEWMYLFFGNAVEPMITEFNTNGEIGVLPSDIAGAPFVPRQLTGYSRRMTQAIHAVNSFVYMNRAGIGAGVLYMLTEDGSGPPFFRMGAWEGDVPTHQPNRLGFLVSNLQAAAGDYVFTDCETIARTASIHDFKAPHKTLDSVCRYIVRPDTSGSAITTNYNVFVGDAATVKVKRFDSTSIDPIVTTVTPVGGYVTLATVDYVPTVVTYRSSDVLPPPIIIQQLRFVNRRKIFSTP